jgi:hypothetical protein
MDRGKTYNAISCNVFVGKRWCPRKCIAGLSIYHCQSHSTDTEFEVKCKCYNDIEGYKATNAISLRNVRISFQLNIRICVVYYLYVLCVGWKILRKVVTGGS